MWRCQVRLSFARWHGQSQKVRLGTFAEAAAFGEMIINATLGTASLEALRQVGEQNLSGKVLIDIANELEFSKGMPPRSLAKNEESLGERIQRAFPLAKVLKTLNTMNAVLQVAPGKLANSNHSVFMSGNDKEAKTKVAQFIKGYGWKDIIDLGDITSARGTEMLLLIWLRFWGH